MLSSMENYTIKEQIGKGAQSTVFIVESQKDKQKYVLKKVECFDESEANKAFKEASELKELQHAYVSGFREFFVLWEKEDSSVFICLLMDYFKNGSLENILEKLREKNEVVPEERIKQWLGQIIEALLYIHKKKVIHRDVRPSNIFVQEDETLVLGDIGVATIMGDAITCTRANEKSINYLAPEVASKGYSENSDVWALGCILFELVTSWMYSSQDCVSKIAEIREDPNILDEVFEEISKHYSDNLIKVLRCMLKTKSDQRPDTSGLLKMPYIQNCVEISDATQLEKRKRLKSASTIRSEIGPVPRDQGILCVLEYVAKYVDYETCVKDAFLYLLELAKSEDGLHLDPRGKKLVAMAMKNNMPDKEIQVYGCKLLNGFVMSAEPDDILFTPEVISVIPLAMEAHKTDVEVQLAAAGLLMAMAANDQAGLIIGHLGGVTDILAALDNHANNAQLCSICLNALWGLNVYDNNVKIATVEKGIEQVCKALRLHMKCQDVAEAACAAVLAMSLDEENLELICELDGVGLLISTISTHSKNSKVVKNACMALASLVEVDEESAYRVLTNEGPNNTHIAGVPIIMKTYELHKDNAEVVESVVTLLAELVEYADICSDIDSYKLGPQFEEIMKKFSNNQDIMVPCEKALDRLREVKHPVIPPTPSPDLKRPMETQQVAKAY